MLNLPHMVDEAASLLLLQQIQIEHFNARHGNFFMYLSQCLDLANYL
jgi:hypothetical protein